MRVCVMDGRTLSKALTYGRNVCVNGRCVRNGVGLRSVLCLAVITLNDLPETAFSACRKRGFCML